MLPRPAPLPMPVQSLWQKSSSPSVHDHCSLLRLLVLAMALLAASVFAWLLYDVVSVSQRTWLQDLFLVLCTLCFVGVTVGTACAVVGVISMVVGTRARTFKLASEDPLLRKRTALLFPIYHEQIANIAATIESIGEQLTKVGVGDAFDVFVLSDSRRLETCAQEEVAFRLLRHRLQPKINVYFRCRADNAGKKAGNIADWIRHFGGAYEHFVILDADSIMSAATLIRLAAAMEQNQRVGLIQTSPRLLAGNSIFARLQQFAANTYGGVIAAGLAAWCQESGNYWGHNAIVRTKAFAATAGLPVLSGEPPFGGHIQSHDFVEAALLRRAGWEVRLVPDVTGSYEGGPPTLIDAAIRDRRWAQGNLQHLRILAASRLPWMSRVHLAMGAFAYLASPLWFLSLLVGTILSIQGKLVLPRYFSENVTLFPIWPVFDTTAALHLFMGVVLVVLLQKLLGLGKTIAASCDARSRFRLVAGSLIEIVTSTLIAPIFMILQTSAVLAILCGRDSGWNAQRRNEVPPWSEFVRFHLRHHLIGLALVVVCGLVSIHMLAWMSPIILGLLFSPLISWLTAKPAPGWLARVLSASDELEPPPILELVSRKTIEWTQLLAEYTDIREMKAA
jgi:membrane glycosyltransferase